MRIRSLLPLALALLTSCAATTEEFSYTTTYDTGRARMNYDSIEQTDGYEDRRLDLYDGDSDYRAKSYPLRIGGEPALRLERQ